MNMELEGYVNRAKQAGQSSEQIVSDLKKNGWNDKDVAEAFKDTGIYSRPIAVTSKNFTYKILIFISLGVVILASVGGYMYLSPDNSFIKELFNNATSTHLETKEVVSTTPESDNLSKNEAVSTTQAKTNYDHPSGLFSLNIPETWEKSHDNNESVTFLTEQGQKWTYENGNLYISFDNINGASSKNIILQSIKISNESNVTIAGHSAERFDIGDRSSYNIPISYNEKSFLISISFEALHFSEEKELIEKVIQSLVIHEDKIPSVIALLSPNITVPAINEADTIKKGDDYMTKYTDPSGVLSIYRPAGWFTVSLGSKLPILGEFRMGDTAGLIATFKIYLASPGSATPQELKLTEYTLASQTTIKISGIDSKKYFYTFKKPGNEYVQKTTVYEIPIASKNTSVIAVSNLNDPDRISEVEQAIKTITIDVSKIK
jgi:hypothetical protein